MRRTLPIPAAQTASATTMVVTATRGNIHQARPTRCAGLPPNLTDLCSVRSSSSRLRDTNTYHLRQPRGTLQGLTRKTPPRGFVHYLYYTIYHEHDLPDWRFLEADPRLRAPSLTSLYRNDKGPREPLYKLDFTPDKSGRLPAGSMESAGQHSASSSRCVYPIQTPGRVRQVGRQPVSTEWPGPPCFLPSNKVFHFCNLSEDRGKTSIKTFALSSFADTWE